MLFKAAAISGIFAVLAGTGLLASAHPGARADVPFRTGLPRPDGAKR
jgi:hypothetical protein